jgi:predicted kinase
MRCSATTFYINGHQIRVADIGTALLNGNPIDPADLPLLTAGGTVELVTRYGTIAATIDHTKLHGRSARRHTTTTTTATDTVLAAAALANLAGHAERHESRRWAEQIAARSLRRVTDNDLVNIVAAHRDAPATFSALAPGHVALRIFRNPNLAPLFADITTPAKLATHAATSRTPVTPDPDHPTVQFERALMNGERPPAKDWAAKQALAASHADAAQDLAADWHPLVRAAACRHLATNKLVATLTGDTDPTVRRAAAATITARCGVALTAEGVISGQRAGSHNQRPRIVFVDIDGTVLDGPLRRDHETLAVLRDAQTAGVHVVAVTGRTVDTFHNLDLGIDLAVCDGQIVDVVSMTALGTVADKGDAVDTICDLLGDTRCCAAGDGAIDVKMFQAVRAHGGRCAWPVTGQSAALAHATDIVGPVGEGGVGRFVNDMITGTQRRTVPAVRTRDTRVTNYASQIVPPSTFTELAETYNMHGGTDWATAHGHVTTAYPARKQHPDELPTPLPGAHVEAYGVVRTDRCTAFAVRIDGHTHQPNGTPYHLTVSLAPTPKGHEKPAVAGKAVHDALDNGTVELFGTPVTVATVAAPPGVETTQIADIVATAAAVSNHDIRVFQRAGNAGMDPAVTARHATTPRPIEEALRDNSHLAAGLVVLIGPPASGKTTFANQLAAGHDAVIVNLDSIRGELNGDPASQDRFGDVLAVSEARLTTELGLGRLVVSDATNVEARILRSHTARANQAGLPAVAVPLTVTRDVAVARDQARHKAGHRAVGARDGHWDAAAADEVFDRMYSRWHTSIGELADPDQFGLDAVVSAATLMESLEQSTNVTPT